MAGVYETVISKDLPDGKKLVLVMDWERDEGLIEGETLGSLPGNGATFYTIGIMEEEKRDFERILQELNFRGGGDIDMKAAPERPRLAFETWYAKLTKK